MLWTLWILDDQKQKAVNETDVHIHIHVHVASELGVRTTNTTS